MEALVMCDSLADDVPIGDPAADRMADRNTRTPIAPSIRPCHECGFAMFDESPLAA
jgi:hypothetical protein